MPTYGFRCSACEAPFDLFRAVAGRDAPATCPACGHVHTDLDARGRLTAREVVAGQILIPEHFGVTLPTTGLMGNQPQGRSGDWENLQRSHARWDSGAKGIRSLKGRKVRGQVAR